MGGIKPSAQLCSTNSRGRPAHISPLLPGPAYCSRRRPRRLQSPPPALRGCFFCFQIQAAPCKGGLLDTSRTPAALGRPPVRPGRGYRGLLTDAEQRQREERLEHGNLSKRFPLLEGQLPPSTAPTPHAWRSPFPLPLPWHRHGFTYRISADAGSKQAARS